MRSHLESVNCDGTEIRIRGKTLRVPSVQIDGRTVVSWGRWLKTAGVRDEGLVEGDTVENPDSFIRKLKQSDLKADIFTFAQKIPDTEPKYSFPMQMDNVAAVCLDDPKDWWENRLPQETRKNVRRSAKRGVITKIQDLDDALVKGICDIYSETPVRQGRRFWHYQKDFETVRREVSTYLERSTFVCAFYEGELIGFIKTARVGKVAEMIHILSKAGHQDKKPTNALIAKAVEYFAKQGYSHLTYGKYEYGNKTKNSLTEFKQRNGFQKILVPRYHVPLTPRGRICMALGLNRDMVEILPELLIAPLTKLRNKWYRWQFSRRPV